MNPMTRSYGSRFLDQTSQGYAFPLRIDMEIIQSGDGMPIEYAQRSGFGGPQPAARTEPKFSSAIESDQFHMCQRL
jgi:hypothetical protein